MTLLNIENISVSYGNIRALSGVSMSVNEGDIVALIGANGAGKSTLMNAIVGLVPLQEGKAVVFVGGEEKAEISFAPGGAENAAVQEQGAEALTLAEGVLTGLSGKAELEIRFVSDREGELAALYWIEQRPAEG